MTIDKIPDVLREVLELDNHENNNSQDSQDSEMQCDGVLLDQNDSNEILDLPSNLILRCQLPQSMQFIVA